MAEPENSAAPKINPLGVDGFLITFGDRLTEPANRAALAFRAAIEAADIAGLEETAASLASTYLRFDALRHDHAAIRDVINALLAQRDWYAADLPQGRRLWNVPAAFDTDIAPQLSEVADLVGTSQQAAIDALCAAPLRVQTIGFAPGQPYLGQLSPEWDIPRQSGLTPMVPEGALVVAIRQVVLFSVNTPTGWRHVGQTALRLFQPDRTDPFLLRPGDEVRFTQVARDRIEALRETDPDGGAVSERLS